MNPIPPAVVTADAVNAAVAQNSTMRVGRSARPNDCDSTSPRASTFKLRAPATARRPITSNIANAAGENSENDKSPISQNNIPRSLLSSPRASMRLTMAAQPDATTTPLSNSRCGVQPPRAWARANTSRVAPKAPVAAAQSMKTLPNPSNMAPNAATAAPPEIPSTYGSASGFR